MGDSGLETAQGISSWAVVLIGFSSPLEAVSISAVTGTWTSESFLSGEELKISASLPLGSPPMSTCLGSKSCSEFLVPALVDWSKGLICPSSTESLPSSVSPWTLRPV
ncbi:hypothetical protein BKA61DRAFT_599284 [Leptodontidium sp. MPI-SDFR-AT-0119]|nr:hypothetical protein BKA61DRAFT_599284 [Leptodontidium sp. MPI-SDFR-AT-0119]